MSDTTPDARGQGVPCECGQGYIVWKPYPPLPFPEVANDSQLRRQAEGGRWVHLDEHDDIEWCPVRRPRPLDAASPSEISEA